MEDFGWGEYMKNIQEAIRVNNYVIFQWGVGNRENSMYKRLI